MLICKTHSSLVNNQITRRDFLKLAGLFPLSVALPRVLNSLNNQQGQQNVIIVVFDAFSAAHISFYGYQRDTTPNIARLADRAIVYHNHYAGGNFTTPGTATILTGTLPWTHRAFEHSGTVSKAFVNKNIFNLFPTYFRIAYTHNSWANEILKQFTTSLQDYIPLDTYVHSNQQFIPAFFENDEDIATVSWTRTINSKDDGYAYSMFLSHLFGLYQASREARLKDLLAIYPRGIPDAITDSYYFLEETIDGLYNVLHNAQQPFLAYFHLWPPHAPYKTHREFYGRFRGDDFLPALKPLDSFAMKDSSSFPLKQMEYDESILYVDREFGRLFDYLEASGQLKDTWVVLTSDHGELFERGIKGHNTPVLYEPVAHVPLMIFEPERNTRMDVYERTSAIDLLPTLLHVTGQQQVEWTEGRLLPPYGQTPLDTDRSIYILEASKSAKNSPLTTATVALIKGQYKLMYFFGYKELGAAGERIELYDIVNDPEELNDLSTSKRETTGELLDEIKQKLAEVNAPYL